MNSFNIVPKLEKFDRTPQHYFTLLLGAFGVILFWRSIWNMLDAYVLPHNKLLSNLLTLFLGLLFLVLFADLTFLK
jgi:hypothetical protein